MKIDSKDLKNSNDWKNIFEKKDLFEKSRIISHMMVERDVTHLIDLDRPVVEDPNPILVKIINTDNVNVKIGKTEYDHDYNQYISDCDKIEPGSE